MDRAVADVIHPIACGLDVHSAVIAACLVRSGPQGGAPTMRSAASPQTFEGCGSFGTGSKLPDATP